MPTTEGSVVSVNQLDEQKQSTTNYNYPELSTLLANVSIPKENSKEVFMPEIEGSPPEVSVCYGPDGSRIALYKHPLQELQNLKAPAYKLRYIAAQAKLEEYSKKNKIKSMVEYGCAELKFFTHISKYENLYFEDITLADIKEKKLIEYKRRIQPQAADFLRKRESPLNVSVCVASIAQPHEKFKNVGAVVAIEVIEHLYPNIFEAMEYNIFGYLQPKLVIFSTPNADFNIVFKDFKGKRDPDHKFEWSRYQFREWAWTIIHRFPNYHVRIEGIGTDHEEYGPITQMAIFERKSKTYKEVKEKESFGICTHKALLEDTREYKVIEEVEYPYLKREELILTKLGEFINTAANFTPQYLNGALDELEIPIQYMVTDFNYKKHRYRGKKIHLTLGEARTLLENSTYAVKEVKRTGNAMLVPVVVYPQAEPFDEFHKYEFDRSNPKPRKSLNNMSSSSSEEEW